MIHYNNKWLIIITMVKFIKLSRTMAEWFIMGQQQKAFKSKNDVS